MRILIADDQAEVRSALKVLLEQEMELDTVSEAEDMESLLLRMESDQPELILLDWELSGKSMILFIPILRQLVKGLKIVALSVRPEAARAAREAGVDAFISKGENSDRLLKVIGTIKGYA
jgi:DNA-binding NarL/FixJ family response regulator